MTAKIEAMAAANAQLLSAGLPSFDSLVVLLRAAENKFSAMQNYHGGPAAQSIVAMREKIKTALATVPAP